MEIHATVRMLISPEKRDEVLGVLVAMSRTVRYEKGCISCRVFRGGDEDQDEILLDELWSDEQQMERHLRSSDFHKVLLLSELSRTPPEFRFEKVTSRSGIEVVEQARAARGPC